MFFFLAGRVAVGSDLAVWCNRGSNVPGLRDQQCRLAGRNRKRNGSVQLGQQVRRSSTQSNQGKDKHLHRMQDRSILGEQYCQYYYSLQHSCTPSCWAYNLKILPWTFAVAPRWKSHGRCFNSASVPSQGRVLPVCCSTEEQWHTDHSQSWWVFMNLCSWWWVLQNISSLIIIINLLLLLLLLLQHRSTDRCCNCERAYDIVVPAGGMFWLQPWNNMQYVATTTFVLTVAYDYYTNAGKTLSQCTSSVQNSELLAAATTQVQCGCLCMFVRCCSEILLLLLLLHLFSYKTFHVSRLSDFGWAFEHNMVMTHDLSFLLLLFWVDVLLLLAGWLHAGEQSQRYQLPGWIWEQLPATGPSSRFFHHLHQARSAAGELQRRFQHILLQCKP